MKYTDGHRTMTRNSWILCVAAMRQIDFDDAERIIESRISTGRLKEVD